MPVQYDSKAEEKFALTTAAAFGYIKTDALLPYTFTDADGVPFNAKCDFIPAKPSTTEPFWEFKAAPLNGLKTVANAKKAQERLQDGFGSKWLNWLKTGFNHSVHKHKAVTAVLPPLSYIQVFQSPIKLKDAKRYVRAGLIFCTVAALPSLQAAIILARHGMPVSFNLHQEDYTVTFNLHVPPSQ